MTHTRAILAIVVVFVLLSGARRGFAGEAIPIPAHGVSAIAGASSPTIPTHPLPQETDFSGYWAHDASSGVVATAEALAGLGEGGAPENLFISQARNGTLVISSGHNPSQPRVYRIGGESPVPAPGEQGGSMNVVSRWQDGSLVSEGSVASDDGLLRIREVLTLSDDGDSLVVEATLTSATGEVSNRLVYRRWPAR